MEVHRLGIKLFVDDPSSIKLQDFVPVFHGWIQRQAMERHLLIDVHDYSHIHRGPGILLVAHEANLSLDMGDGRPGLLYYRKLPVEGTVDRFAAILKYALQACSLIEDEPALAGRVRFRTDEFLILANDRLHAPNADKTFAELEPMVAHVFKHVLDGADFRLNRASEDPKERFAIRVETSQSAGTKALFFRTASSRA